MKHCYWLTFLCLSWGTYALAAPPLPTAGGLLPPTSNEKPGGSVPPLEIQAPKPPPPGLDPAADASRLKIVVNALTIVGAQAFSPYALVELSGFHAGQAYALDEVRDMASRMERYYHAQGFLVAQVYLPAQDIRDGVITITVAEGHYGQVLVRNQTQVSAAVLSTLLQGTQPGEVVRAPALESALLRLSDLPGVQIKSALVPGATFGTSDLLVDVLPGRRVTGSVDADSAGNYYTGALRVGATLFLNEPTGEGDVASLRLLTSGEGLNYFRAAYQLQIGQIRAGAAFSSMEYTLGQEFESLLANGTARTVGFFGSYPLLRSRTRNLVLGASYESKRFEDRLDAVASTTEKAAHVFTVNLSGDQRDNLGAGGLSTFALGLSSGSLTIQTAAARTFDATTAQSNGYFNKLAYSASRMQHLNTNFALVAAVNGQLASKNLDASEKLALGGMTGVRAYPEGEGYGDTGYVLNLEARWLLPRPWQPATGQLQLVGFVDTGSVTLNQAPWTAEANQRTLSGTGIGLNWSAADQFQLRLAYAHKLGNEVARSAPDANDRLWLQAIGYF